MQALAAAKFTCLFLSVAFRLCSASILRVERHDNNISPYNSIQSEVISVNTLSQRTPICQDHKLFYLCGEISKTNGNE